MGHNAFTRKLAAIGCLDPVDEHAVEQLCKQVQVFDRGRDIVESGDRPTYLHVVLEGWAASYKLVAGGERQISAFFLPGDLCDPSSAIGPIDQNVRTLSKCRVALLKRDDLDQVMRELPNVARAFWLSALSDEGIRRSWIVNLGRRKAYQRLAHLFCELHIRASKLERPGDAGVSLPLTQQDLADAAGLTQVHVNRMIRQLKANHLIALTGRRLRILNPAELQEVAGFDPLYLHPAHMRAAEWGPESKD